jgi:hypothetical protein
MHASFARKSRFPKAPLDRDSEYGVIWSFPTVEQLLVAVDSVAVALGAKGERILDSVAMRAALTAQIDSPPAFCVLAIARATGPWQKPGAWHVGRVGSNKGKGLALTLTIDAQSMETIMMARIPG